MTLSAPPKTGHGRRCATPGRCATCCPGSRPTLKRSTRCLAAIAGPMASSQIGRLLKHSSHIWPNRGSSPRRFRSRSFLCRPTADSFRRRVLHGFQVCVPALVKLIVGIAHRIRLAAAEHDLEIDRFKRVILITMDNSGRTRNALPRPEPRRDPPAAFVLDKDIEQALQHEKTLLDFVGVRSVALARLDIHD